MKHLHFELNGTMPLLMHQDSVEQADTLTAWRKDPGNKNKSAAGDDRSPSWTWQTYCYTDESRVVMPYENVMVCLRQGATQVKLRGNKTYKELSQSGLVPAGENCEFLCDGKPIKVTQLDKIREAEFSEQADAAREMGFRLFVKRARVGQSKHIRVRPRFDNWTVKGSLIVMSDDITQQIAEQIFVLAGRVGIGDWRPGCKTPGPFGMFEAKLKFS